MSDRQTLLAAGTSSSAIEHHYDLPAEFFRAWLGDDLVYSCALWDPSEAGDSLARAQERKLDYFAGALGARGARVLDIGCGWGALLDRFASAHGLREGVGLTLSPSQAAIALRRGVPGVDYRCESWVDHEPAQPYDAVTCIEATEHFASDALDPDAKVEVYRSFFDRVSSWLVDGGRVGLQLICQDDVDHERSRPGRGRLSELIRTDIFPESMPGSLSELVLGWETPFRLVSFLDHSDHYRRTFRAWALAARDHAAGIAELVGPDVARTFSRYFAAGEACFRLREHSLHRVVLVKRPRPKQWAVPLTPSAVGAATGAAADAAAASASPAAVRSHYDLSNGFYRLWLGPTMMYSSRWWEPDVPADDLDGADARKIDRFASLVAPPGTSRVLDIGCGWGWALRRLVAVHGVAAGVGLTLSPAQHAFVADDPIPGVEVRVESWEEHQPAQPYGAIVSFGAFEHVARDGSTSAERVATYRRFFGRCYEWLEPDGRLALESITHDDAPDTAAPLGRGPLGDFVLEIFPESICPHLSEVILGSEPYFHVELLRSDAGDFARTCRAWRRGLQRHTAEAAALVGEATVRRWSTYLAASEIQFRLHVITNLRLVLRRRQSVRG